MKGGQPSPAGGRWRALAESITDEQRVKTLADLALTFAWLTDSRDVWMKGLEGIMLRQSPYLDEVRAEMRQQDTLDFLEARFPGAVPAAVVERVRAETDLAVLGRWIQLAGKAESPEAFQAGMG